MNQQKHSKGLLWLSLALILIVGFAAYANSLRGKFLLDDETLILSNIYIKDPSHMTRLFTGSIDAGAGGKSASYRPLQLLTYMLDYRLWGLDVRGYHLSSVVLHILTSLSLFWLVSLLFGNWFISLLVGLLFVLHPVHSEAVSYISGRADSLVSLFMLLCFVFYVKSLKNNKISLYVVCLLTYALALLSRENALILPLLFLIYHYSFKEKLKAKKFLPILSLALLYITIRFSLLRFALGSVGAQTTFVQRVPGSFVAFLQYLRLLIAPFGLHMEYGNKIFAFSNPQVLIGILAFFIFLVFLFKMNKAGNVYFFAASWFLVTLLPSANLYPVNAFMAEHWLYLPSIGFFIILARLLDLLWQEKRLRIISIIIALSLSAFYFYSLIRQNEYWREPISFYERTLKLNPQSSRTYHNLAKEYATRSRQKEAIALFEKAIELDPEYAEAYSNLGFVYFSLGSSPLAIAAYEKAIELDPEYAEAYSNLGYIYHTLTDEEMSIALCSRAIEINPFLAEAYNNLGLSYYYALKEKEKAKGLFQKAQSLNPDIPEPYYNLANLYSDAGENEKALEFYQQAIKVRPDYIEAYYKLGLVYNQMGLRQKAIEAYKKTIQINPNLEGAYYNLGLVYYDLEQMQLAIEAYKKAIEVNPDFAQAYHNLGLAQFAQGKTKDAIVSYRKAVELDPYLAKTYSNLALIHYRQGDYKIAIAYFDKARALGFVDPNLLKLLEPHRDKGE
ncbi:MAG: tetratricopeptide repeat protein [Candidatus Omnitrophica bacterium]|nr:tetratricopeptide repeat protein [Candidatus Omnitrophota bacterium]